MDIPEDIAKLATQIFADVDYVATVPEAIAIIAEALLAERLAQRERDAQLVGAIGNVGRDWALTSFMGNLRRDIAAAIRQPEPR